MSAPILEPWLRGESVHPEPVIEQLLFTLQQVRENLRSLEVTDPWRELPGIPPLGFHLKHISGSLDRLTAYLESRELSAAQLAFLASENLPDTALPQLLQNAEAAISRTEVTLRGLPPSEFDKPRYIGRRRIRVTAIGLAIHIAEHTQRHCGQAITTAKLLAALTSGSPLPPPA